MASSHEAPSTQLAKHKPPALPVGETMSIYLLYMSWNFCSEVLRVVVPNFWGSVNWPSTFINIITLSDHVLFLSDPMWKLKVIDSGNRMQWILEKTSLVFPFFKLIVKPAISDIAWITCLFMFLCPLALWQSASSPPS